MAAYDSDQLTQIRLFVDGELSHDEAAALEARASEDAGLQALIDAERSLRQAVRRAANAGGGSAPADLRDRIQAAWAADRLVETPAPVVETRRDESRWRISPAKANVFAVAAVLLLVTGVVMVGLFAPSIDQLIQNNTNDVDLVQMSAQYAAEEHGRCASCDETRARATEFRSVEASEDNLSRWLQADVRVVDLTDFGFTYIGAGACTLPQAARAGHLMYERVADGKVQGRLSVFVTPMSSKYNLDQFAAAEESAQKEFSAIQCAQRVMVARDRQLVYFVVACDTRCYKDVIARLEAEWVGETGS